METIPGNAQDFLTIAGILAVMSYGYTSKKVDVTGALSGGVIAALLYFLCGLVSITMFMAFFVLGSMASRWKWSYKVQYGLTQENEGIRTYVHAFSNTGAAVLFALLSWIPSFGEIALIMVAGSFATATSDTMSSELGNVYGSKCYNILSLKLGQKGRDGMVSVEGTLFGVVGAAIIAGIFYFFQSNPVSFILITTGGIMGNLADSIMGATLQRHQRVDNHWVNFLATLFGGIMAGALFLLVS